MSREFDLRSNKQLKKEAVEVYHVSEGQELIIPEEKYNIISDTSVDNEAIQALIIQNVGVEDTRVEISHLKYLLNQRKTVTYRKQTGNASYIAVWYPLNELQQIKTAELNSLLTETINQNFDTRIEGRAPEYNQQEPPMQVVYHNYTLVKEDGPRVDIEITFNFPYKDAIYNRHTDTVNLDPVYYNNRFMIRFMVHLEFLITKKLDAKAIEAFKKETINNHCAMRLAMTQEFGSCYVHAVFNVIRLSPQFSKLIQSRSKIIGTDYVPNVCDAECIHNMYYMADVRNKRRILTGICAKPTSDQKTSDQKTSDQKTVGGGGSPGHTLRDICKVYQLGCSIPSSPSPGSDVVLTNSSFDANEYQVVGSLIYNATHVVCGYFCDGQQRVFDSKGVDIAYDWSENGTTTPKGVYDALDAKKKEMTEIWGPKEKKNVTKTTKTTNTTEYELRLVLIKSSLLPT
jgi:hypothetical protein